ncbi:MAG: Uma2 family endonuclease [Acidobacteria bacterium]|nr:Uma2 family endonuclease [Acidobacteriota bacterium]
MTAQPDLKRKYTVEEYIELLKNSEERFEYFDGQIFRWLPARSRTAGLRATFFAKSEIF